MESDLADNQQLLTDEPDFREEHIRNLEDQVWDSNVEEPLLEIEIAVRL